MYIVCGFRVIVPLFFINFFHFFDLVFSSQISIGIDMLWAQLLLEYFLPIILKLCIFVLHSLKMCVFLGLSSYHKDLKVTTLYWQSHDVGGCFPTTVTVFYPEEVLLFQENFPVITLSNQPFYPRYLLQVSKLSRENFNVSWEFPSYYPSYQSFQVNIHSSRKLAQVLPESYLAFQGRIHYFRGMS